MNCNRLSPSEIAWNTRYDNSNSKDNCCNVPGTDKKYIPFLSAIDENVNTSESVSTSESESSNQIKEEFENQSSKYLEDILQNKKQTELEKSSDEIKQNIENLNNNTDNSEQIDELKTEIDNYKIKLDQVLGNITNIQDQLRLNKEQKLKLQKIEKYERNNRLSKTSGGLLFFYLMIAGNYVGELFSHQMINALSLRWMKHIVAFSLLLFTISDISGVSKPIYGIGLAIGVYIWFIFTTKLDFHYNLVIILLLIVGLYVNQYRDTAILNYKNNLDDVSFDKAEQFQKIQYGIIALLIIITTIGNINYIPRHYHKYKKYYSNPLQFLINFLYL